MTKIRTILILVGLFIVSFVAADPGTGSGTGLKPRPTINAPVVQISPADTGGSTSGQ